MRSSVALSLVPLSTAMRPPPARGNPGWPVPTIPAHTSQVHGAMVKVGPGLNARSYCIDSPSDSVRPYAGILWAPWV
jgi:hypothetical protein